MSLQDYMQALEQRFALRRDLKRRLQGLSDAHSMLTVAAGKLVLPEATLQVTADPLGQIEPLVTEAGSLSQRIRACDAEIAATEKALAEAQNRAKRVRGMALVAVMVVIVVVVLMARASH